MKRALRDLLSLALPLIFFVAASNSASAQCPVVLDSVVVTDVTCAGANDGSITIYVGGGFPDYTYQIFNPPALPQFFTTSATSHSFTGLNSGSGDYQVIVVGEDGAGGNCSPVFDFATVNDPPPFTMIVSTTNDTCPDGNVGTASLDVSGGVLPYTFSWPPFPETSDSISGLDGGTYSVIATDANGCAQSEAFTIVSPPDWAVVLTPTDPTCNGGNDGEISSSGVTGGNPPYTFSWTGTAQTTENLTGLTAGSYTLTVTDSIGCVRTFPTVTLGEPTAISIQESHIDITCFGETDGSIDISVSGGTAGYTYLWQPGGSTGQDTTGLGPGTYEVFVTDAAGCTDSLEVTILEPTLFSLSSSFTDATCNNLCDGTASVTPTGGTPGYTFAWTPNVSTGPTATALCAGTYDVLVTDARGCEDSASFTIADNLLQATVDASNATCNGTCDGTATTTVTGPNGPFTYDWQPSGGNGPTASNLCAGNYTVTVSDATGCSVTEPFTIVDPDPIIISLGVTDVSCEGGSDGAIDLTVSGGTPGYTYQWYPLGQTTEDIDNLPAGDYSILV
ncbi:MAG: SprB repeat-containing protein, partial [Flavobacteriales bacterium]